MLVPALTVVCSVGNIVEYKRLLVHTLELWRGQGNKFQVAETLELLATGKPAARPLHRRDTAGGRIIGEFSNSLITHLGQAVLCYQLAGCCIRMASLVLQKKLYPNQSISSWTKMNNLGSVKVMISLVIYATPRVRQRRPSTTLRQPLGLHLLPTGIINSFGSFTPWHRLFLTKAGSMMHMLTLNVPSHTQQ
jgi:hypothetical protein